MSKFPPPKFYATDKDVHDLLTRLNMESLIAIGKSRGLIVSHSSQKDIIISYFARQMFSHPQLQEALKLMEHEDREERATPSKLDADVEITSVAQAFERVRDERKDPDERMEITQRPSGELEVKYAYTHLDFSQATLRQRTTKEITFLIQKNGNILDFSYNNNAKAVEIYSEVKAILKGEEPSKIMEHVSLSGIKDSGKRVSFFHELMNNIEGFRLRTVLNIKAERMDKEAGKDDSGEIEKLEEMVKNMALTGGSVWSSPEFKSMVENGFFVYRSKWLGTELDGDNRTIEFEAGFSDGECADFSARAVGYYKRNESGGLEKKTTALRNAERELFRNRVQKSAFECSEKIHPFKLPVVPEPPLQPPQPAH